MSVGKAVIAFTLTLLLALAGYFLRPSLLKAGAELNVLPSSSSHVQQVNSALAEAEKAAGG